MPTPWSSSGSLVSDRIRQNPPLPKQQQPSKGKGKGKAPTLEPPRSKPVRALEARLDGARGSNGRAKDPRGGCFCQARNHALSSYVPMCRQCGLILCMLNPPYCACPHCATPLLDEGERAGLVERLERELVEQLAKEEADRQRTAEEARAAEGAFPTLPGSQMAKTTSRTPAGTRTVLSLNSQTKKVTVSSYSASPPGTLSRPASRGEEEELGRVPGPPAEVTCVTEPVDVGRPWRNGITGEVRYVPRPAAMTGRRKRKGETNASGSS